MIYSTKESKEFLSILEENISEYSKTADVSSIDDIRQKFGEELCVAEEFSEGYHPSEVRKRLDIKRLLSVIIISFSISYVLCGHFSTSAIKLHHRCMLNRQVITAHGKSLYRNRLKYIRLVTIWENFNEILSFIKNDIVNSQLLCNFDFI